MLSYRIGSLSSPAQTYALAAYLVSEVLRPEIESRATYYLGEHIPEPETVFDRLGRQVLAGELSYSDAVGELMAMVIERAPRDADLDYDGIEEKLSNALVEATTRADFADAMAARGGTTAEARPDIDPALADRLGIPSRPMSATELGRLLNGRRADGNAIEGKKVDRPMRSIVETFGLDHRRMPTPEEVDRVLSADQSSAGRRADPRKRFLAAYGVPFSRDATADEIANIRAGKTASGLTANSHDVRKKLNARKPPTAYIDMTWSADKSVSIAWALAQTEAERAIISTAHRDAVASAMRYVERSIGFAKVTRPGEVPSVERATFSWVNFHHYTSRPVAPVAISSTETAFEEIAPKVADPQLHTHVVVLNAGMTESGRVASLYLDQLDGMVKQFGHIYQAYLARNLRAHGVDVAADMETGSARIMAIPSDVRTWFSRRSEQISAHARELAPDWDTLAPAQQIALLRRSVIETRERKQRDRDGPSDFASWRAVAERLGYHHRTVLRPDDIMPERTPERRRDVAYDVTQPLLEAAFARRAKFDGVEIREMAARGLVTAGIGDDPGADIDAITAAYRERGVRQDGRLVGLIWGKDAPLRGRARWSVTTALHEEEENRVIDLAGRFASDRSAALPERVVRRAVDAFLDRHPEIDRDSAQWREQRAVMGGLAWGGRLAVAFGAAGAGKSTFIAPLVDAYHARGQPVYGTATAWRHAGLLADAGVPAERRAAIDAFLHRAEKGRYKLDPNSVVIIEELSLVGRRHMLALLHLQQKHGFKLVAIGDPKQGQAVEAPVLEILTRAIGRDAIPEIVSTVRQRAEREREIACHFRDGHAGRAIAMKREDGTAILVGGGAELTVRRVAELWRERMTARGVDLGYTLTVSAPTNDDATAISAAIRIEARSLGRIGQDDLHTIKAIARGTEFPMPLAVGDQVRLFERVGRGWAANGEVVTIIAADASGMRARNSRGVEAVVPWGRLREHATAPVRLAYGYAMTIDAVQGATSSEHIDALPSGSQASQGLKGYVAESRHRDAAWLVVDDASERRQIGARIPLGDAEARKAITEENVWRNVAANLSEQPTKATAVDFISRSTDLHRGTVQVAQRAAYVGGMAETRGHAEARSAERHPTLARYADVARTMVRSIAARFHDYDRGVDRGVER